MHKQYSVYIFLFITLARFYTCHADYKLALQTDDSFFVATFARSLDNTSLNFQSILNLNHSIADENISSIAVCRSFLYYTTQAGDLIRQLGLDSTKPQSMIERHSSIDSMVTDPFCRTLFFSAPSSTQLSASNISLTDSRILTPRILTADKGGYASISSLSYDYLNFQLVYSTNRGELYHLGFNRTRPNKVREGREIVGTAVSNSHLFTLERDSSRLTLRRYSLTQLTREPVIVRTWGDSEYFEEFTVTADGKWLFYIDASAELHAMDISSVQALTTTFLFSNLPRSIRSIRLIPDQLTNVELSNPCSSSGCSHLCLPVSATESTCSCPNGEKQRDQSADCLSSRLEGSTLVTATDGMHVLRTNKYSDDLTLTLLPLSGYTPHMVGEVTAAEDRVYWSEHYVLNSVPYSIIRTSSVETGHTYTVVGETLGRVSGLVVDRMSDSLFWSDSLLRRVEVSRRNGLHRRVLYGSDVIKGAPTNLVADLVRYKLYWVEQVDGLYRIMSADMNPGSLPQELVNNLDSVSSLTLDASLLYWSGQDGVRSVSTTEPNPSPIVVNNAKSLTDITVHNAKLLSLKSLNSTSLFSGTSLLLRYSSRLLNIAHIVNDSDRVSSCRRDNQFTCSHLCLPSTSETHHPCLCSVGYRLRMRSGTESYCEVVRETLYISQPGYLKVFQRSPSNLITNTPNLYTTTSATASAITGDVRRGHIYWSDTREGVIGRMDEDGSNQQVIQDGFQSILGLAFDALSGNLYWSDNTSGVVGISTPDGSLQKVLIHARDDIPFSLASNPRSGEIYFGTQTSPLSIRSMHGNTGNNRQIIRTQGKAEALLHVEDKNSKHLIWARNSSYLNQWKPTIQKCTLPSCDDAMTFFDLGTNTFGLAASQDKLYSTGSLVGFPTVYFLQQHYLPFGSFEQIVSVPTYKPGALYLSHISSQPKQHYCAINNGGCSHFCLLGSPSLGVAPQEYVCECPVHMKLSEDGRNCQDRETFLFVLTEYYILALNKYPYIVDEAVPVGTLHDPRFISFDPIDKVIYWVSDASQDESVIRSYGLDKGKMRPSLVGSINRTDSDIFRFEVEWIGKYAFWTRSDGDSIEFINLEFGYSGYIFHNTSYKPRALALDPTNSRIFFSDWSDPPSICSIGQDGRNLTVLVSSDHVSRPSSLIYSRKHDGLFWYDYDMHVISKYDFKTEQVVVYETFSLSDVELNATEQDFDRIKIAISGDELVWWEKFTQPLMTRFHYLNLITLSTSDTDLISVGDVYHVIGHTADTRFHHNNHPCSGHTCQGICSRDGERSSCSCPLYTNQSSSECEPFECPFISSCIHGADCSEPEWRCDGRRDCMDGSDEANCTCNVDQFTCNSTKKCIPEGKRCDGISDCLDNSDEVGCMTLHSSTLTVTSTTSLELDVFEKSYLGIILALIMTIILLFIVCIFILIVWLICLHRPFYNGFKYKIKKSGKADLEKCRSTPSYSESELQSETNSSGPILKPKPKPMRKSGIILPPLNTQFTSQSPDIQLHLDEHYNSAPLCFGYRSAPLSLDVPTVDLVSIVTDQSLNRSEFDYDTISNSRVPPPSVNTNNSSVFLSVSQQDIPAAVESGIPDGTTLNTGSQHMIECPHPNSEISTVLTNTYYQPSRPNHVSCLSSHYTQVTTNISSLHPGSTLNS